MGRDTTRHKTGGKMKYFNPHAPGGARPAAPGDDPGSLCNFNPHAPGGARHQYKGWKVILSKISIHTPQVGRDAAANTLSTHDCCDFNPHAPGGARHCDGQYTYPAGYFNPHAPGGARPANCERGYQPIYFNPHAPGGARPMTASGTGTMTAFQSTRPRWGATGHTFVRLTGC